MFLLMVSGFQVDRQIGHTYNNVWQTTVIPVVRFAYAAAEKCCSMSPPEQHFCHHCDVWSQRKPLLAPQQYLLSTFLTDVLVIWKTSK
ncbi:hypothetical protein TNCV_1456781 [Trichonephila clavipes]|nr:hypothetical protein TNCV_1456781 [Trichonephila clavipes]